MRVLIDADGWPVVDAAVKLCRAAGAECLIVCDTAHEFKKEGAQTLTVGTGPDSVDLALVNRAGPGDIVVTQDYGLAALCLAKGARVLNQDGVAYTRDNIDGLLAARHVAKKARRAGKRLKGPAARTAAQDAAFEAALGALLAGEQAER